MTPNASPEQHPIHQVYQEARVNTEGLFAAIRDMLPEDPEEDPPTHDQVMKARELLNALEVGVDILLSAAYNATTGMALLAVALEDDDDKEGT